MVLNGRNNHPSVEEILRQASSAIKAGQKEQARRLLYPIIKNNPNNTAAWELLTGVCYNKDEEVYCLNRILTLQPGHAGARQRLESLRQAAPPAQRTASPSPQPIKAAGIPPGGTPARARPPAAPNPASRSKRRRRRDPLVYFIAACFGFSCMLVGGMAAYNAGYLPLGAGNNDLTSSNAQTATALANCQYLIDQAMQASDIYCDQIGPNQVCYGNFTIQAELDPAAVDSFEERGDIIQVQELRRLSASPLDLITQEWGIAVFRVEANLPRSLPGEYVTMIVFGNTTLENPSQNLETFYFFSELGQIVCQQVPFDGILLNVPDGSGIQFTVNGTEVLLMGNASLNATVNGDLEIALYSGTGSVTAAGQTQNMVAGQQVSVPLGGPNGTDAAGPPSAPAPLSGDQLALSCAMTGQFCSDSEIPTLAPSSTSAGQASATAGPSATPFASPTGTRTPTRTPTRTQPPPTQPPPTQPPP
ncbi:MAG: hypothetical protein JXB85_17270, partial [Anaerolineales bacterium]|nr:hypothetical protein [Anaerolineales bacterium]